MYSYNPGIKQTVLVVDNEKDLVRVITRALEPKYRVLSAGDAETALSLIRKQKPDLLILDIVLPGMDGLELLGTIRRESQLPVIMLSGRGAETDRILGLKLGADDYVVKPFSVGELAARVERSLRRAAGGAERTGAVLGKLAIDFERHEVKSDGKLIKLAPKEFEILRLLVEADGRVLSREDLLRLIWGAAGESEIDIRAVDQHVARLRRKLGAERARILTVPNFGYKVKL